MEAILGLLEFPYNDERIVAQAHVFPPQINKVIVIVSGQKVLFIGHQILNSYIFNDVYAAFAEPVKRVFQERRAGRECMQAIIDHQIEVFIANAFPEIADGIW